VAQKENRRKVRAILAGGLVLGIGAAVTLAAWSDSEFATGSFGAGHFNMQGSLNGTAFSDHPVGTPAQLAFPLDKLSPTETVAAPYVLRLDKDTTNDATVQVVSANGEGSAEAKLSYGIVQVDSYGACSPTATGTQLVQAGTALDAVTDALTFELRKPAPEAAPGDPGADVFLCIQVKAASDLDQNTTAVGTWGFLGESNP
jgi:predicted ribosomally synthesized peptide with SipW-like signal peptide